MPADTGPERDDGTALIGALATAFAWLWTGVGENGHSTGRGDFA